MVAGAITCLLARSLSLTPANFLKLFTYTNADALILDSWETLQSSLFNNMISWAITFLIIALIAAVLGFGGIAGTAIGIAKIIFFVFIVLFLISLLMHRRGPRL